MTDTPFPSKSQMKRREVQCVTHHNACDCREAKFKRMEEFIADLKDEVSETEDLAYQLNENSKAVEKEVERLRKELAEQCRVNGMGAEREAKLLTEIDQLKNANGKWKNEFDSVKAEGERAVRKLKSVIEQLKSRDFECPDCGSTQFHFIEYGVEEKLAIAVDALEKIAEFRRQGVLTGEMGVIAIEALEKLK